MVLVQAGAEIGAALDEGLGGRAVRNVEDHHHSGSPAVLVAQGPDILDIDVRLAEEIRCLLLDRLRDRFGAGLEETHPRKQHRDSPWMARAKARVGASTQHEISEAVGTTSYLR